NHTTESAAEHSSRLCQRLSNATANRKRRPNYRRARLHRLVHRRATATGFVHLADSGSTEDRFDGDSYAGQRHQQRCDSEYCAVTETVAFCLFNILDDTCTEKSRALRRFGFRSDFSLAFCFQRKRTITARLPASGKREAHE